MKKCDISALMRAYVRDNLSPTGKERDFVSAVYESVQNVLGVANCLQIGSYPRFTAITPLHDLDVLYILGKWEQYADPSKALSELESTLKSDYENPSTYSVKISRQTHSITIVFSQGEKEVFSVDIVPAYIAGKNEFGDDTYVVPEIAAKSHSDRRKLSEQVAKGQRMMAWIKSDPRGYISIATKMNAVNDDFRKAVKLVKGWRGFCKEQDENFPLKSFHAEQAITAHFAKNPDCDIHDEVLQFFTDLPQILQRPQIPDRADPSRYIDEYVNGIQDKDKRKVLSEQEKFLKKLENFSSYMSIDDLLRPDGIVRSGPTSTAVAVVINGMHLADFSHKKELEDIAILSAQSSSTVAIDARLYWGNWNTDEINRPFKGTFSSRTELPKYHWLKYTATTNYPEPHDVYWQVVNTGDHAARSYGLRGQIQRGGIEQWERSEYSGVHWIECFVVDRASNKCVCRSGPFYVGFRG